MADQWLRQFLWGAVPVSTLSLACMPLFGPRAMVAVIAIWLFLLVIRAWVDPVPVPKAHFRRCAFLALPFALMLLDILRAPDLAIGWKLTERSASLLLFPAGFLLLGAPASRKFRDAMLDLFIVSAVVLAVFANVIVALSEVPASITSEAGYVYNYRAMFSTATGLHPPYAAYFFLSAALFQITRAIAEPKRRAWRAASIVLLFMAAVLLASRMPLFAFVASVLPILLMRLPRKAALGTMTGLLLASFALIVLVPGIRLRTMELFHSTAAPNIQSEVTSTNIRMPLAHCTIETISDHWLLGTGQANAQTLLDDCYRQFNIPLLLDGSYSTHNQLLHWWLCFGMAGLALFIVYFGALLRRAWRARDAAHLAFLIFLLLCMTTENLLARQWGVVLFACFNALFTAAPRGQHDLSASPLG